MDEIKILHVTREHISAIADIERECFSTPFSERDVESLVESSLSDALVAVCADSVLGYVSYNFIIDECQIINVAVRENARRLGIGSRIMNALVSEMKEKGARVIMLEVRKSNESAIKLYEKFDFIPVGVSKNHFSSPREDAILMNLEV